MLTRVSETDCLRNAAADDDRRESRDCGSAGVYSKNYCFDAEFNIVLVRSTSTVQHMYGLWFVIELYLNQGFWL